MHADDAKLGGAGLSSPEKGKGIYCRVNSSQVMVATGRLAGPRPPSEPNALLWAERVEGAWEARRDSLRLGDAGGVRNPDVDSWGQGLQ